MPVRKEGEVGEEDLLSLGEIERPKPSGSRLLSRGTTTRERKGLGCEGEELE